MSILDFPYSGAAYEIGAPDTISRGRWYSPCPESETIAGAFRVVEQSDYPEDLILGNGESPEKFWLVREEDLLEAAA